MSEYEELARFPSENPSPVMRVGRDGVVSYANAASAPVLAEWGVSVGDLLPDDARGRITSAGDGVREEEWRVGERIFLFDIVSDASADYINIYARDVTERRRMEAELRKSEEQFRILYERSPVGIAVVDLDYRFAAVNDAYCDLVGYTRDVLLGKVAWEIIHPDNVARDREKVEELRRGERESAQIDRRYIRGDGTTVECLLEIAMIHDEHGKPLHMLAQIMDISVLKETEKKLRRALDEVRTKEMQLIQQERQRALVQMASGIAHDFNNAVFVIKGLAELLLRNPAQLDNRAKTLRSLEHVHSAAKNAAEIVRRMRKFYRPTEDAMHTPLDINQVIMDSLALTQPRWRQQAQSEGSTIEVVTELGETPPVMGSESELHEVFTNLILNAANAMPASGTLTITSRTDGESITVDVRDTGCGMDEATQRRCFEPFFTTSRDDGGSGLGLSMVQGIVARHGGHVGVESTPGVGTVFHLSFPAFRGVSASVTVDKEFAGGPSLHVLVVEDDEEQRWLIHEMLETCGHTSTLCPNGREALENISLDAVDVVVVDRAMPIMSGDEVARAIREHAPAMPIIMLTGFGDMMDAAGDKPECVDLVLGKPVTASRICDALNALTGRRAKIIPSHPDESHATE